MQTTAYLQLLFTSVNQILHDVAVDLRPPAWRCLSPAIGHARDHLAEMDLLKRQLRAQRA